MRRNVRAQCRTLAGTCGASARSAGTCGCVAWGDGAPRTGSKFQQPSSPADAAGHRVLLAPAPGAGASERAGAYRPLSTAGVWFGCRGRGCVYTDGEAFAGRRRRVRGGAGGVLRFAGGSRPNGKAGVGWGEGLGGEARRGEARRGVGRSVVVGREWVRRRPGTRCGGLDRKAGAIRVRRRGRNVFFFLLVGSE